MLKSIYLPRGSLILFSSSICTTKPTKQWQKQARRQAAGSLLTAKAFVKSPVGLSCGLSVMIKAEETPGCINR